MQQTPLVLLKIHENIWRVFSFEVILSNLQYYCITYLKKRCCPSQQVTVQLCKIVMKVISQTNSLMDFLLNIGTN